MSDNLFTKSFIKKNLIRNNFIQCLGNKMGSWHQYRYNEIIWKDTKSLNQSQVWSAWRQEKYLTLILYTSIVHPTGFCFHLCGITSHARYWCPKIILENIWTMRYSVVNSETEISLIISWIHKYKYFYNYLNFLISFVCQNTLEKVFKCILSHVLSYVTHIYTVN